MDKIEIHASDLTEVHTLYKLPRSVGETIQLYEDVDGRLFIKVFDSRKEMKPEHRGQYFQHILIDHADDTLVVFGSMIRGVASVRVENKKFPPKPRSFA